MSVRCGVSEGRDHSNDKAAAMAEARAADDVGLCIAQSNDARLAGETEKDLDSVDERQHTRTTADAAAELGLVLPPVPALVERFGERGLLDDRDPASALQPAGSPALCMGSAAFACQQLYALCTCASQVPSPTASNTMERTTRKSTRQRASGAPIRRHARRRFAGRRSVLICHCTKKPRAPSAPGSGAKGNAAPPRARAPRDQ